MTPLSAGPRFASLLLGEVAIFAWVAPAEFTGART